MKRRSFIKRVGVALFLGASLAFPRNKLAVLEPESTGVDDPKDEKVLLERYIMVEVYRSDIQVGDLIQIAGYDELFTVIEYDKSKDSHIAKLITYRHPVYPLKIT